MNPTPGSTALLRTGQLVLRLEPDGQIAGLTLADQPALDRIYPTVRGPGWTTIPGHSTLEQMTTDHDAFTARVRHEHRDGPVAFIWTLALTGEQGHITITATGRAETDLTAERLGLCLLHPNRHVGRSFTAATGQRTIRSSFTAEIRPDRLAQGMTALVLALTANSTLTLEFHGTTFDLEDHRNWSDLGWKTYSPTLDSTHPSHHTAGTELTHRLEIGYECAAAYIPALRRAHPMTRPAITFTVGLDGALPELTQPASQEPGIAAPPNSRQAPRGAWFEWDPAIPDALTQAARTAATQATALDIAILLPTRHRITDLAKDVSAHAPTLRHLSVFDAITLTTPPRAAQELREALRSAGLSHPVGGGSLTAYAGLNRAADDLADLDFLSFGLSPQTHHSDDESVMGTTHIQRLMLSQALRQAPGKPIIVGPITFRRRSITRPDPRMETGFYAAWLLATISALRRAHSLILGDLDRGHPRRMRSAPNPAEALLDTLDHHRGQTLRHAAVEGTGLAVLAWDCHAVIANLEPHSRTLDLHGADHPEARIGPYATRTVALRVDCRVPA
jgi:D-apionolactonase